MSRSIMAARFAAGRSSALPNMRRCANSPDRWPKRSRRCRPSQPKRSCRRKRAFQGTDRAQGLACERSRPRPARSGAHLLAAYPVPLGPSSRPTSSRGASSSSRIAPAATAPTGDAQTPMARKLDPPPIAFADRARASQRSPFALYQVINQGLEGTAMQSFAQLPDADKWALAFQAGRFAYPETAGPARQKDLGRRSGGQERDSRSRCAQLLVGKPAGEANRRRQGRSGDRLPAGASRRAGRADLHARHRPRPAQRKSCRLSRRKPRPSQAPRARRLSRRLRARRADAERPQRHAAGQGRAGDGASFAPASRPIATPMRSARRSRRSSPCSMKPKRALAPDRASNASAFLGAFTILLREGLEALLIVVAMLAFLSKADRPELTRPVHVGWTSALAAGVLTWWVATSLITVSGASRELTEGFGSLLAAAVLLFVGIWMHGKAQAGQWQRYIREKLHNALAQRIRAGSCSRSPSSPFIARCSRRSCSSPRWQRRAVSAASSRAASPAAQCWRRSRSPCCASAGACRSANSSPTALRWSRSWPSCSPERAWPRSRKPA